MSYGIRESTEELYGLDPMDFLGVPHEIVLKKKIDACWEKSESLNKELMKCTQEVNYEIAQGISYKLKRIEKARVAMTKDYEEMGLRYERV